MKLIAELVVRAFVLIITAYIIPGFKIDSFLTAVIVAFLLGLLNMTLKPILIILTLPATILTLGLFTFVINAVLLLIVSKLISGFQVDGFLTAIIASIVIAVVSGLVNSVINR